MYWLFVQKTNSYRLFRKALNNDDVEQTHLSDYRSFSETRNVELEGRGGSVSAFLLLVDLCSVVVADVDVADAAAAADTTSSAFSSSVLRG